MTGRNARGDVPMNVRRKGATFRSLLAIVCMLAVVPGDTLAVTSSAWQATASSPQSQTPKTPPEQLDSLVAPIALYSDPLLAQTLAAATYPLEVIQLKQWMDKNKNVKGKALSDAVGKQPWDASIQSMAAVPDVVTRLAGNIQWTTDLGNAFLAQQQDVMDAGQRMRAKAQTKGTLKTSKEQVVQSKSVDNKDVIVIEQANPQTVYVP